MYHATIDWIAYTVFPQGKPFVSHTSLCNQNAMLRDNWHKIKARNGYHESYQSDSGCVVSWGIESMGIHVVHSGQALQGVDALTLIQYAKRTLNAAFSRLDIAIDCIGVSEQLPKQTYLFFNNGRALTSIRKANIILNNENNGVTVYFGSRESERFVRVYNKRAERLTKTGVDVGHEWIRCEAELKGERARSVALFLAEAKTPFADNLLEVLLSTIDFPDIQEWPKRTSGVTINLPDVTRKLSNTRAWIEETCIPSIARECREPRYLELFIGKLMQAINADNDNDFGASLDVRIQDKATGELM